MPPRLVLKFLGLPQVFLDEEPVATDRRKAIALLAYLAVNDLGQSSRRYSRESLSALFWPDYEQAKAFSNLRRVIWEVRQAIGENWLIAERETVQLNPDAKIDLDVAWFQELLSQSRQHGDPAFRIPLLSDAVKLYRDHFLTGFSLKDAPNFNEWAFAESEGLRRKLSDALTMLSADHCTLGQADKAIPYARRLVALDHLDESAHRQLMEIYWQAGQHSAALKQYQTCEQLLRKELGVDPQPETYALYKQIRKGEIKPGQVVKSSEQTSPRHNLPLQLSSFIGREEEQKEIAALIASHRLVTLTGAGGIGKSRLSIQIAFSLLDEYPNGTWLVELAPLSDPALVPQVIVNTLGLLEQANRPAQTVLTDFLREKMSLLILDNCEHLIQACAQLAEALLHTCSDLHILATSREALGIAGETVYLVPPLATPDLSHEALDNLSQYESVRLFLERAPSALHNFSLTQENSSAIAQVCHRLDGIPLAIELAAARVKVLRVEEIAARLEDRFRLLTGGARTAFPRHQTLQAMIDWSYDLLTEPERILLRRLSVFAGGWSLEAAESVCAGDGIEIGEILDCLTQLVNKSLVMVERKQGQETRYLMLETIRQYARGKLWAAGEGELMRQRHLAYFLDLAERAEPNLRAFGMMEWLDRLEAELDNIRAALECALESDVEAQLRLASALLWFWHIRGHKNEGIEWLERGLSIEAAERGDQPLTPDRAMIRGKALNASGFLMNMFFNLKKGQTRFEESLTLFQERGTAGKRGVAYALLWGLADALPSADNRKRNLVQQSLTLFREVGDKFGAAECLMQLTSIARNDNDFQQALLFAEEQLALRKEIGDQDGIASALYHLGYAVFWQNDLPRAITLLEESLAIFRQLGNKWSIGLALSSYGDICSWQGNYKQATEIYEKAFAFAQDLGDRYLIALNLYSLGVIAWFQGDYAQATQKIEEGLTMFRDIGEDWMTASSLHALGDIALAKGEDKRAVQWYEAELAFGQDVEINATQAFAFCGLGKVAWTQSNDELAIQRFEEGLKMSQEADFKYGKFHALYGLGRVSQSKGDYATARTYFVKMLELQRLRLSPLFRWNWLKTYGYAIAYLLEGFAVLAAAQNQMRRAASLLGMAENLYIPLRFEMSAKELFEHDQAIAAAHRALGEEAFTAAYEEWKKMTLEEAVAYAEEESES